MNNMAFVAIKMGRRQGARSGAYLKRYVTDPAGAGQPPAHFHRNPPGRGQLAVFPPPRRILTYQCRYARRPRLEKQPTDPAAAGRKPCYSWDRTLKSWRKKRQLR